MVDSLSLIADRLYNNQQSIVGLTEGDYDATPIIVTMQQDLKVGIDLKIESQAMSGDTLIWGHSIRGIWGTNKWGSSGSVGFILGSSKYGILGVSRLGSSASSWVTEENLVNI